MKLTVPFSHAILGCAGEAWDVARGSLATAGTKKLSKAWDVVVLAKELAGQTPGLPGNVCAPPIITACDLCM